MNSTFSTALLGSLAGAFAGAIAAQHIMERSKRRDELLKELRNTNAAITVSFSICNAAIALKKQHIQPIYEKLTQDQAAFQTFKQPSTPQQQENKFFHIEADFKKFEAPLLPMDTLKDLLFNKVSAYGRPLGLVTVLDQSANGITNAIARRHQLIDSFEKENMSKTEMHAFYLGVPLSSGDTNQEYPDLVWAIYSYVNDIAFFSSLLCSDLIAHGNCLHEAFRKQFGKGAPKISSVDFSKAREIGLIPPDNEYSDWLNGFSDQRTTDQRS